MNRRHPALSCLLMSLAGAAVRADDSSSRFPKNLDGQLARISAEFPCELDDDTWKLTRARVPPVRVACPWSSQTITRTRALWSTAVGNAARIPLSELRRDASTFAGEPYVFSGQVRAVEHDLFYNTHIWLTTSDGQEVEAVASNYLLPARLGETCEVVGYLAGWSERGDEQIPALAATDSFRAGEIVRTLEAWRHETVPHPKRRWIERFH